MVVKTFRGLLADGGQDRIRLQTIKGKVGYQIIKFQVLQKSPGAAHAEATVKIYKNSQSTVNAVVDFTDSDLLAAASYQKNESATSGSETIIFDTEIVNQDIYVTSDNASAHTEPMNYYIELEVIPLDDAGAEYTTLKDMRQT